MSFWDNVKKFTRPYSDDEGYDEDGYEDDGYGDDGYEEPAPEPAPRTRRTSPFSLTEEDDTEFVTGASGSATTASSGFSGQIVSSPSKHEVVLYHAKVYSDATKVANDLRDKKSVVVNMENVDKALVRRIVDFLSGCVYALDGDIKKISQATYLFCPHGINVTGNLENLQTDVENYV